MFRTVRAGLLLALWFSLLALGMSCGGESNPFKVKSERVTQADSVSAMQFAPDGRLFYAQQAGDVRIISADGSPQSEPFTHVDAALNIEWGLTGLALDPDFAANHYVYIYYSQPISEQEETITPAPGSTASPTTVVRKTARPVVVRFTDRFGKGEEQKVIVGDLPVTLPEHPGFNANGKIHFGKDGFLYITVGDYDVQFNVPDHPSQSLHPQTGKIFGSDNTPVDCEELNIVEAGGNYGWPKVGDFPYPDCGSGGQKQAIHYFAREGRQPGDFLSFVEISSFAFVTAAKYPTLGDALVVCQLGSENSAGPAEPRMRRISLAAPGFDQVTADDVVVKDCKLSLAVSPDGTVYYSNDKEIRKLLPETP